ncbi:triose-phosphate isomerase [Candidatus Nesciobacter abundans]|uniref:triose-phosphate isomerase n=1 Tax=Candidatus Nesciobacter abundans TaxID=2601668 RepID=UPI0016535135|nr:triose-phosphate isomerase [Candidatus Nesciobacter abundans]
MFFVISNWKGFLRPNFEQDLNVFLKQNKIDNITNIFAVPFVSLNMLNEVFSYHKKSIYTYSEQKNNPTAEDSNIFLSAQNSNYVGKNSTGNISSSMLKDLCTHILCGHSETRSEKYSLSEHAIDIITNNLIPIIFVENHLELYKLIENKSFIKSLSDKQINKLTVILEPKHYIGKASAAPIHELEEDFKQIKNLLKERNIEGKVCYGGSLNKENIWPYVDLFDGICFGRFSLSTDFFPTIYEISSYLKNNKYQNSNKSLDSNTYKNKQDLLNDNSLTKENHNTAKNLTNNKSQNTEARDK